MCTPMSFSGPHSPVLSPPVPGSVRKGQGRLDRRSREDPSQGNQNQEEVTAPFPGEVGPEQMALSFFLVTFRLNL